MVGELLAVEQAVRRSQTHLRALPRPFPPHYGQSLLYSQVPLQRPSKETLHRRDFLFVVRILTKPQL